MAEKKILIVEGSSTRAAEISYVLEDLNLHLQVVANAAHATRELDHEPADVVIAGSVQGIADRYAFCRELKSSRLTSHVPVLLLISPDQQEDLIRGLTCGADAYVVNPYTETGLISRIQHLLKQHPAKGDKTEIETFQFRFGGETVKVRTTRNKILDMILSINESMVIKERKISNTREKLTEFREATEDKLEEGSRELQDHVRQVSSMEEQLQSSRNRYRRLAENSNAGVIILDLEGHIEYANDAMAKMLDTRSVKYLIGKHFRDSFYSVDKYEEFLGKIRTNEKIDNEEYKLITSKKMPRWAAMNLVLQDDKISGMIFDRTGKKFMEERDIHYRDVLRNAKAVAERADKMKSMFLKSMAVQVKGPLNQINGYASLLAGLESAAKRSEKKRYLDHIRLHTMELNTKISHMLDLAGLEAGKIEIREDEVPVIRTCADLCREAEQLCTLMGKPGVSVHCNTGYIDEQLIMITDAERFSQLIRIMLNNAVHFTNSGTVELNISREERMLKAGVRDQGAGIPGEFLRRILGEEGYSPDGHHAEIGLGLTVARMLAELMGGKIEGNSEPGKGSEFYIYLPLREKKQDSFQENVEELALNMSILSGKTVLLAEDVYNNYLLLNAYLEHTGARIIWVKNGKEAIRQFESGIKIDLVLLDIKMPEMDGLQAIRAIRTVNKKIPIIVISAFETREYRTEAEQLGINDFIPKPVEQEQLLKSMATALQTIQKTEHE